MIDFQMIRALTRKIFDHPYDHDWSYQGLGMLRLYLSDELRLHLWCPDRAVVDVSTLHDHPWHFESLVVSGEVFQNRYEYDQDAQPWLCQKIKCGSGGGLEGGPTEVTLRELPTEFYGPGEIYRQRSHEVHKSEPSSGTVTLIRREFTDDVEHARVFWPTGEEWVSAEPRPANRAEVRQFVDAAKAEWDDS